MRVVLDKLAWKPTRAHPFDGGLDLYTPVDVIIPGCTIVGWVKSFILGGNAEVGCATIDTGVHIQIPEGYVGLIKSKSGLNVNYGLTGEGVIDAHYTGSIRVKLYNHTRHPYAFRSGEKIAQLVIVPCLLQEVEVVDSLEDTDRGDNGFGSTGR